MNERIKELWENCDDIQVVYPRQGSPIYASPELLEKFAEKIVRECMLCCEQVISDPVPESVDTWLNGGSQCIQEIKKHFGVEE